MVARFCNPHSIPSLLLIGSLSLGPAEFEGGGLQVCDDQEGGPGSQPRRPPAAGLELTDVDFVWLSGPGRGSHAAPQFSCP